MATTIESSSTPQFDSSAMFAFPLTSAQLRLWFLEQLPPDNTSYLIAWALRIRGDLDAGALQFALSEIVKRHEVFRTCYVATGGEPVQLVKPDYGVPLPIINLTNLDPYAAEAEARRLARIEGRTPISLEDGPMIRAQLLRLNNLEHVLLLTTHHICFDGWSRGILLEELRLLYDSRVSGQVGELPELPIQYGDFAVWQKEHFSSDYMTGQLDFWMRQLKDLPTSVTLPTDRSRPAVQTYNGKSRTFTLPRSLLEKVKQTSQREGVTLFMTLLAAFDVLVARYTGQEDIVLGTPTANRNRPELEGVIGLFANTLVLRTQLGGDPTFRELLERVKETALSAYAHEDMPFEQLVHELGPQRSLSQSPLFQMLFSLRNTPGEGPKLGDLQVDWFAGAGESSKYDISMYLEEVENGLGGKIEYNTDLFDASTIERILDHYETLLESAIEDPGKQISKLEMLGKAERQRLLVDWNNTAAEYPRDLCVHQLFERQAGVRGHATAVEFGDEKISYAELNRQANQLAHALHQQGVGVGQRVGLFVERSVAMFVGLLGIQKSGAAYVPLDPSYPPERVRATLDAGGITLLVSTEHLLPQLPDYSGQVICLDRDRSMLEHQSAENLQSGVTPDDLIYVIFTSGSTGKPKGVELGHRGVVNLLEWMRTELHFGERDVFPALASFAFDMSVPELYLALATGGTVALAPKQLAADGEELARFLRKHSATLVHATPTTWSLLLDAGFKGENITRCVGAEPLPAELFGRLMSAAPGTPLYNFYGPTETTVWSTFQRFDSAADRIVIGRPLANTQLYIVDQHGNPAPVGVPGELLIGGDGVAKGYLNQPELTAEKFIPDTFSRNPNGRLYRTGDLGRYLPDGRVEFAGRIDHQVKIRGFRIELGEIETVLAQMSTIRECVATVREDEDGDKRLVAYVVFEAGSAPDKREMRGWVKQRLPEYMVPSSFVVLERMPLSPNGKVDRKALPAPATEQTVITDTMGNPIEELIANIWAEVLKVPEISETANFFDLGGHSLLATKLIARIRQALRVDLPLAAIFDAPTVAGLAARVQTLMRESADHVELPLEPSNWGSTPKPLSFAQQRLWYLDQVEPNSSFYNVPMALRLTGPLDESAMKYALAGVVARHESLRTTLQLKGTEPVQQVALQIPLPLTQIDLTNVAEADREAEASRTIVEAAEMPFDLAKGPLFRAMIVKLGPEDHILFVSMHHAISDGWSQGVLMNDLTILYDAHRLGVSPQLPSLGLSYGDFSVWQRKYLEGGALERQLGYWKQKLAGAPPTIELPTDRVRPPKQTFQGSQQIAMFSSQLLERVNALSRAEGSTLFITVLAAFNLLMSRYSGQTDIVIGTANAGRQHQETEGLIGYFVNTLVLRTDLEKEPTFRELIHRVRETTLDAFANQDLPFEKLVEELNPVRDLSRSPIFQVMLIQQNAFQRTKNFELLRTAPYHIKSVASKMDLLLNISEVDGQLRCAMEYNTNLYDAATIERMLECFGALLENAVAEPSRKISEISVLSADRYREIVVDWNATAAEYPKTETVHHLIEEQVARTPDAIAVVFGDEKVTLSELNRKANHVAHTLRDAGIGRGNRVAIYLDRSTEMLIALLGVMKSGAAYVPLDPAYPSERLRIVIEDADISCLLTQTPLVEGMPAYTGRVICLDTEIDFTPSQKDVNPEGTAGPNDSIYVMFTSGSTGRPKGVEVTHRPVVNYLTWMQRELNIGAGEVFAAITSYAFDPSVPELYLPMMTGGTTLMVERRVGLVGQELAAYLTNHGVTTLQATPTTWGLLLEAGFTGAGLKRCIGAEALPQELFERLMNAAPGTPLYNLYGPTEATIWATSHRFTSADELITIGRPISNATVYIVDAHMQPVPIGVSGSLYIGGDCVTTGYFGRPELTAERFVPNPFVDGTRMYCTGDVARFLPDGRIEFMGRADNQVKIRGFRIELGEIEALLGKHPAVRECVVVAREDQPGNRYLAGYVVAENPEVGVDPSELRLYLKDLLPDYMVPTGWLVLASLPLTPNGKVDRKAMPAPDAIVLKGQSTQTPQTIVEVRLANIWEDLLNVTSVKLDDDFFDLGGHSLLAVQMMGQAREAFGFDLPLHVLFTASKLGELAQIIQNERGKHPFKPLIPIRKTGTNPPLFCVSRPNVNALGFIFLARNLSPDQPVIGLQTKMDKDGTWWVFDQSDYEEKAREYIEILRESYPEGPYFLTGYCEGAHIAFEMARQLEQMNLHVGMIAILDAWPVENTVSRTKYILRNYWREVRKFRRKILGITLDKLTASLLGKPVQARDPITDEEDDEEIEGGGGGEQTAEQVRLTTEQIKKRYWPGPDFVPTTYSGRLTLFRTKKQLKVRIIDYKMGWGQRALGGVDVYPISGSHFVLLREPSVIEVAKHMQQCIDRALEQYQQESKMSSSIPEATNQVARV